MEMGLQELMTWYAVYVDRKRREKRARMFGQKNPGKAFIHLLHRLEYFRRVRDRDNEGKLIQLNLVSTQDLQTEILAATSTS